MINLNHEAEMKSIKDLHESQLRRLDRERNQREIEHMKNVNQIEKRYQDERDQLANQLK